MLQISTTIFPGTLAFIARSLGQGFNHPSKETTNKLISAKLATALTASFAAAVPIISSAMQLTPTQTASPDIQNVDYFPLAAQLRL